MYDIGNQRYILMFCHEKNFVYYEVWIIVNLHKKLEDTEQADNIFSFYLLLNMLKSLLGIFRSCVWQTRSGKKVVTISYLQWWAKFTIILTSFSFYLANFVLPDSSS